MDLRNKTDRCAFELLNSAAAPFPEGTPYLVITVVDGEPFMVTNIAASLHERLLRELLEKLPRAPTMRVVVVDGPPS